jgi:hypothetical protein
MRSIRVLCAIIFLLGTLAASLAFVGCGDDDGGDFCATNCSAVLAAGCTNGPTDHADCMTGCDFARTSCPSQFNALAGCAGSSATYECDANDSPAPVGCDSEIAALNTCMQG